MLPIVERELRVQARRPRVRRHRLFAAVSAVLVTTGFLFMASFTQQPQALGTLLFSCLAWPCFALCLVEGIRLAADCLSEERREGTLGLLLLTDLQPLDVVLGKLAGVALNSAYIVLAVMPCLGVPFFLGGITAGEFWRLLVALGITLGLSLAVGLAISSCVTDSLRAWAWTAGAIFLLAAGPPFAEQGLAARGVSLPVSACSPWRLMDSVRAGPYDAAPGLFWGAALCGLALTGVSLAFACRRISRPALDDPGSRRVAARALQRRAPRALLDQNPAYWLAARQGWWSKPACAAAWTFILSCLMTATFVPAVWQWILGGGVAVLALGYYILIFWQGLIAVRVGGELRSQGAAELLLATPLTPRMIVLGLGRGLIHQSLPLGGTLLAGELLIGGLGCFLASGHSYALLGSALVVWIVAVGFVLGTMMDLWGVVWMGLYQGLHQPKRATATARTVIWIQIVPLLILGLCAYAAPAFWVVKSLVVMLWARDRLLFGFVRLVRSAYDHPARSPASPPPLPPAGNPLPSVMPGGPSDPGAPGPA